MGITGLFSCYYFLSFSVAPWHKIGGLGAKSNSWQDETTSNNSTNSTYGLFQPCTPPGPKVTILTFNFFFLKGIVTTWPFNPATFLRLLPAYFRFQQNSPTPSSSPFHLPTSFLSFTSLNPICLTSPSLRHSHWPKYLQLTNQPLPFVSFWQC